MTDQQLLQSLVGSGFLTESEGEIIARDATSLRKSSEQIITERRIVPDAELAKVKSKLLGIPYKAFKAEETPDEILKMIPETTARTYAVFPLGKEKGLFIVGMVHPDDTRAQEALRFIAKQEKLSLGVYLIAQSDFDAGLRRYAPFANEIEAAVRTLKTTANGSNERLVELEAGAKLADEAPVIKIVATLLKEAVNLKASDIHIEPERTRLRVRFRVDGELQEQTSLPAALYQPVVSRVKVLANLKIDENRIPQDGRFRTEIFGRNIDFRVATFPTPLGEKAAIRVLDPTVGLRSLDDLGLVGRNKEIVERELQKPFGMILITGPTGSGKTTTLYALLQKLNTEHVNIVSLEDPVEYVVEGVNQSQVRPEIGYDFASGLRQILRQDPDIIMVGEIRDTETAALAVHAALTGHIVFSTLHTNNAVGVVPRLIDMKVDAFLLPSALNLMMAQRLIGRLCSACKVGEKASDAVQKIIENAMQQRRPDSPVGGEGTRGETISVEYSAPYIVYRAPGCEKCKGKGVVGRIALFEVMIMTKQLGELIGVGVTENKLFAESARQGMITLRQDGIMKALQGLVSIEEVLKETSEE